MPILPRLSHHTIALARIHLPLLRPYIEVYRPNELKERIVVRFWVAFFQPLVSPDQQAHEDLDLLQREVEADAHPLAGGEAVSEMVRNERRYDWEFWLGGYARHVIGATSVLYFLGIPPVEVKGFGVVPT